MIACTSECPLATQPRRLTGSLLKQATARLLSPKSCSFSDQDVFHPNCSCQQYRNDPGHMALIITPNSVDSIALLNKYILTLSTSFHPQYNKPCHHHLSLGLLSKTPTRSSHCDSCPPTIPFSTFLKNLTHSFFNVIISL